VVFFVEEKMSSEKWMVDNVYNKIIEKLKKNL